MKFGVKLEGIKCDFPKAYFLDKLMNTFVRQCFSFISWVNIQYRYFSAKTS